MLVREPAIAMKLRTARRVAFSVWALTLFVTGGNALLGSQTGSFREDAFFVVVGLGLALGYSTVGALIASRHPGNAIGWLFCAISLGLMAGIFAEEYSTYGVVTRPESPLPGLVWAVWLGQWIFVPFLAAFPLILLLFPTGRVPSPRWRPLTWVIIGGAALATLGWLVKPGLIDPFPQGPGFSNPTGIEALRDVAGPMIAAGGIPLGLASLASVGALFFRYRGAGREERQQIRWLAYVALAAAVLFVGVFATGANDQDGSRLNDLFFFGFVVTLGLGVPIASGIAILKYRLYELDVVVKKTVVFGVLAAFITVVYVGVVVGIPLVVLGTGNEGGFSLLPFAAAAIAAVAFQPVRERARRLADRLVYGQRATPYEVLSEFSDRVGGTYSTEDVLPRMAELIGAGTGASAAEVWLRVGLELRRVARWPSGGDEPAPLLAVASEDLPEVPGVDRVIPVRHQGELLGAIAVAVSAADPLTPSQDRLLHDLAAQAGLVLRNVRLIEELRASRQRLVAAQDHERRRIERNLHDGAQQQLVALSVKLRLAEALAQKESAPGTRAIIETLQHDAQDSLETLRDLARGIYPPLLADKGLPAALQGQARKVPVPVHVQTDGIGRFPQEVEAAVYFCCLEAIQNTVKYARASRITVSLEALGGRLGFSVRDDGAGFDSARAPRGSGLQNMADRLSALGGELHVRSSPGDGTTVEGWVPAGPVTSLASVE
jgi:signal transduction histidine kinase